MSAQPEIEPKPKQQLKVINFIPKDYFTKNCLREQKPEWRSEREVTAALAEFLKDFMYIDIDKDLVWEDDVGSRKYSNLPRTSMDKKDKNDDNVGYFLNWRLVYFLERFMELGYVFAERLIRITKNGYDIKLALSLPSSFEYKC